MIYSANVERSGEQVEQRAMAEGREARRGGVRQMSDEEQSGFTFTDKRRVSQEPAEPSDSPSSTTSGTEPAQSSSAQETDVTRPAAQSSQPAESGEFDAANTTDHLGAMPRLNVRDRLLMCIDILNQGSWISLGLISDPATGSIERDLGQAKTAIDCVAFLSEKIEPELDDETRRELRNLVRDLQLNYVQQSSR